MWFLISVIAGLSVAFVAISAPILMAGVEVNKFLVARDKKKLAEQVGKEL